jgi:hypothetical protein
MNPAPQATARPAGRRFDPKYTPFLVPAIMAIAMSFVMSLVQTIARLGFAPNLASPWLTSFAIGAAVAIPTAILVAPSARRLAGHLTGTPRNSPPGNRQPAESMPITALAMPIRVFCAPPADHAAEITGPPGGPRCRCGLKLAAPVWRSVSGTQVNRASWLLGWRPGRTGFA